MINTGNFFCYHIDKHCSYCYTFLPYYRNMVTINGYKVTICRTIQKSKDIFALLFTLETGNYSFSITTTTASADHNHYNHHHNVSNHTSINNTQTIIIPENNNREA